MSVQCRRRPGACGRRLCYHCQEAEPRTRPEILMPNFEHVIASPTAAYEEGLAFFRGQGVLNNTLVRIVADLERHGIAYADLGAVALHHPAYQRLTVHLALLM